MQSPSSFVRLLQKVKAGDAEASARMFQLYNSDLKIVVRRRLSQKLQSRFDPDDILQSVWKSFFVGRLGDREFDNPSELIHFLMGVATNKLKEVVRQNFDVQKRDPHREQSLAEEEEEGTELLPAKQPTPSQEIIAKECMEHLKTDTSIPVHRILELREQRYSQADIAEMLGISQKTVNRILNNLRKKHDV